MIKRSETVFKFIFLEILFIYIEMSDDLSAKYHKKERGGIKICLRKKKNMVANDIKISQKIKYNN